MRVSSGPTLLLTWAGASMANRSARCTGQQLIDAGTVLINGERVGLDLQIAEGSAR
jgi:hypothetical protein